MNIANIIHNFTWRYLKTIHRHEIHSEQGKTTDDLLAELSQYGHPKLLQMDTGWWCFIEATDATAGAKLTIGSEIRHTHHARAISECLQRVEASGLPKHPTPDTTPPPRLRT